MSGFPSNLGLSLAGGPFDLHSSSNNIVYVRDISPTSFAYGKIKYVFFFSISSHSLRNLGCLWFAYSSGFVWSNRMFYFWDFHPDTKLLFISDQGDPPPLTYVLRTAFACYLNLKPTTFNVCIIWIILQVEWSDLASEWYGCYRHGRLPYLSSLA